MEEFLRTSRNSALLPGQDADHFFLELCKAMEIGIPRVISEPLGALERVIAEVSAAVMDDADIRAEIALAQARLQRLRKFNLAEASAEAVEPALAAIRAARLAGKFSTASRMADAILSLRARSVRLPFHCSKRRL